MSVLENVERRITARLTELQSQFDEYNDLSQILANIQTGLTATNRRTRTDRPPRTGSGGRADQAIAMIKANPGTTVTEISERMSIGPTYLYKLLPALEREDIIRKVGRGYESVA